MASQHSPHPVTPRGLAGLGEIMQIAFVPQDFEGALKHWTEVIGAGPFIVLENTHIETATHRGSATAPVISVALGHWGDMQIELIRQENRAASPYREWLDERRSGMHHTCVVVDDIEAAKETCRRAGAEVVFTGSANDAHWFYADTGGGPGTLLEVLQPSEITRGFSEMVREAARDWDGTDPVRRLDLAPQIDIPRQ